MASRPVITTHRGAPSALPRIRRRIRVLLVIDSLPLGGAEQLLVTLARSVDAAAYELRVCSLHPLDEHSPVVRSLRALDIPIDRAGGARRHDPRHVLQVAALVRKHRIDVLHTHLPYANTVGILAGRLTRRPAIVTLHSIRDVQHARGRMKQRLKVQALRWGAHVIIACAPEVAAEARERLHLPPGKLVVVPNGIDIRTFAHPDPDAVRLRHRELLGDCSGPLVVTVGNVLPAKGHQYLVDATPRLLEAFPGARVVIVGRNGGSESHIQERIAMLGLEGRVVPAGQRRDIPEILAAADLFVLPSLWEGLPLALLEAMAAGTPVVATAVGGVVGVVDDGVTGRLVPPADTGALARAMVEMLGHHETTCRMAAAARAHVQATYGAEAWAERLQSIYSRVANGSCHSRGG